MQAILSEALPLTATPKRGNTKMGNKIDINLCKSAKAKKQCHSLPYSVLRIRNDKCKHFKCGLGVAITGKPALIIDCISHPALEEP